MFKNNLSVIFVLMIVSMFFFGCLSPTSREVTPNTQPQPTVVVQNSTPQTITPPSQPVQTSPSSPTQATVPSEVSFNSDGWQIYGDLYPAISNPTKVIILSHMYSHDRSDYPSSFIDKLHQQIPDAVIMAIDLRGHGKSINKGHDIDLSTEDIAGMKNDVIAAKNFAKSRYSSITQGYAVGASIGSTASIMAAGADREFTKVAMLAPGLDYRDVDIRPSARAFSGDLLLVSSNNDPYSTQSINELLPITGARTKQTKIYPEGHGAEIFGNEGSTTPAMDDLLVNFLKN